MDKVSLDLAREKTRFEDIGNFNFESLEDFELKEFARELFIVLNEDFQAEMLAEFTVERRVLPFVTDTSLPNEMWAFWFEDYLLEQWRADITQYLIDECSQYEHDTAINFRCSL